MAEELRNIYNSSSIGLLISEIKKEYKELDAEKCHNLIFQEDWGQLALKERMRRITISLHTILPKEYKTALEILYKVAPKFTGLKGIIFPDYVELYGLEDWEESMRALAYFTPFSTSEFAVRPFLINDLERMLDQMLKWSIHPDEHIRRLASEGSRPRLPWGQSVPSIKANPKMTLPILNNLKEDDSLYVRKSVANHLNDISYIRPDFVLDIANDWYGNHTYTDWIIKHACRALLKKGNQRALLLFGYQDDQSIEVKGFKLEKDHISIGDSIQFSFSITSKSEIPVRVEYAIDYVKSRGQRTKKVFMISTLKMNSNESKDFSKTQSFKELTTRKHYKGTHTLSIIINGAVKDSIDFELV
jgi:3-methyladenine DNA glycosylase AlkC